MGKRLTIILLVLMMTFSLWIAILPVNSEGNTVLSFSPAHSSAPFPWSVTLNVTVSDVVNLNGWQIKVVFNPAVLACSDVTVPDDNMFGPLSGTSGLYVVFDNTVGYAKAFIALMGTQVVSGSGTLCQITFSVLQPGVSAVSFANVDVRIGGTSLFDANVNQMPFRTLNGNVQVGASGFQSYTFSCIRRGIAYNVGLFTNSTVSNFNYNEIADTVTFFLSGVDGTVGSCTGSIPLAMMNGTLSILVDGIAINFSRSQDSLNSYLCFFFGQSTVRVDVLTTMLGDLNGDRKTDMRDLAIVAKAFGSRPGSSRWNPIADTNGDGIVDMKDVSFVAKNFGRTYLPN